MILNLLSCVLQLGNESLLVHRIMNKIKIGQCSLFSNVKSVTHKNNIIYYLIKF